MMEPTQTGDLAQEYADARVETEQSEHTKRFMHDAQQPFEDAKRQLAQRATERDSAKELLEYMKR